MPVVRRHEIAGRIMHGAARGAAKAIGMWWWARAAEVISAVQEGKRLVDLNHLDTPFAPAFAVMHPQSQFILVKRDPMKTFNSFFTKGQWSERQIRPLYQRFDDERAEEDSGYAWKEAGYDIPTCIAWYFRWTETFMESFASVLPRRCYWLDADRLFSGEESEYEHLSEIVEVPVKAIREHYKIPRNQKSHKIVNTDSLEAGREAFVRAYTQFGGTL